VRALALLEPGEIELVPSVVEWLRALGDRLGEVAASAGVEAVGEAMIGEALGEDVWPALPEELRRLFTRNGAAILAEQRGDYLQADASALAAVEQPVLLVAARESVPVLRELIDAMAEALPDARTSLVDGGHLIDPASPEVIAFIQDLPD
jgi:pimeloyl-ACP methyl ester carboxylesterase